MNSLCDVVGGANLFGGLSYSFTNDRFNNSNSAIYLNIGYLKVPPDVYFSGDFTVTAWIYLKSYINFSRIIDFGNGGAYSDNIFLAMDSPASKIKGFVYKGTNGTIGKGLTTIPMINLNQWYFVSFVLNGTTGYIYVNGSQTQKGLLLIPNNITRKINFIGSYNKPNAIYDEIKIYQGALTSTEIMTEYKNNSNNGK